MQHENKEPLASFYEVNLHDNNNDLLLLFSIICMSLLGTGYWVLGDYQGCHQGDSAGLKNPCSACLQ
jgi:hypothetical protein